MAYEIHEDGHGAWAILTGGALLGYVTKSKHGYMAASLRGKYSRARSLQQAVDFLVNGGA